MSEGMEQIKRLYEQTSRLYQEGRYQQALSVAQQACDLTKKEVGAQHPDFAVSLNTLAGVYQAMGDHAAALPLYRQALEVRRAALGERHPDYARSLTQLEALYRERGDDAAAEPLRRQVLAVRRCAADLNYQAGLHLERGDNAGAEPLLRQALELYRAILGENHPDYVRSLSNLAELYRERGDHAAAEPLLRQALEVERAVLGENHPLYATRLISLGELYRDKGDFAKAEPLLRQALEIRRAARAESRLDYASSLNSLALLYRDRSDFERAEALLQEALEVKRDAMGESHSVYASGLEELARLYQQTGDFGKAEALRRRALEIKRAALSERHPDYASSLHQLAVLYDLKGDYVQAGALLRQALEVYRATLGERHPDYASILMELAVLHQQMGDYAQAEPLLRQALEVYRATLGERHPNFAVILQNLAVLYSKMGDYARPRLLYRQALEITRSALGERHPDCARGLHNLAISYMETDDHAQAESLLRQALEIRRSALGERHPDYAVILHTLAGLYQAMGDHAAALPLCRQTLEVTRAALGEHHPQYAASLHNLALLYVTLDRPSEALPLMEQEGAVEDRLIGQVFSIGSERQRMAFLATVHWNRDQFLSLTWRHLASSPPAVAAALSLLLRRKAVAAESLAVQHQAVLGDKYPDLRDRFREWAALRMQIARATLAGSGPEGPAAHREHLSHWQGQQERLEADLARQIPEMNAGQRLRSADCRAVACALPAGAALVEFVRFHAFDFKAVRARGERHWQPARYLAFVLRAGADEQVRMIDLGEAEPIDRLVAAFRAGVTGGTEVRDLVRESLRPGADASTTTGDRLRAAVFDPLADALGACRRIFLAPDGDLTRLPFEALPLADGRHLLDAYRLSYVSVGRDLLRFSVRSDRPAAGPLVAADPDFDLGVGPDLAVGEQVEGAAPAPRKGFWSRLFGRSRTVPARQPAPKETVPSPAAPTGGGLSRDLDRSRCHFARLPGTRAEGERIARRLGVQPLLDGAALEGRLKACRSPRILHLATHGFFLPDQPRDPNQLGRNLELIGVGDTPGLGRLSGPGMENPMLRSGLALAGANTFLRGAAPPPEAEDGLLTAEDVAGLDLLDTELVVLSACETGLGAVHVGEGVFGLRRAFTVAGAKTLVMSLWKVPDLATAFLMDRFYDNLLTRGLERDLALSEAQRATRDVTVTQLRGEWLTAAAIEQFAASDADARRHLEQLARQPDDHRPFESPFYWGAFICQGDPAPLALS
jgi:tetratricopeptide (TPR) repeat protein